MILPNVERMSDDRSNVPIGRRSIDSISSIEATTTMLGGVSLKPLTAWSWSWS